MRPKDQLKSLMSSKVAFHRFVLLHRKHQTDLFCFFEGTDSQYYFPRINSIKEEHHPIICGNKKSLLETHEHIKKKYANFKTVFFADSDFDENTVKDDLYFTCGYSIENFYCSENVFSRILKNEFFLKVTDHEYLTLMELFHQRQKEYHQASALFNLWYFTAKRKANGLGQSTNINLDEKFPKDFITFSFEKITAHYTLTEIKRKFPLALEVTEEDLNNNRADFFAKEPRLRFRGKFEIEFFIKYLNFVIEDANKNKRILTKKTKFKIDSALVLTHLSQYADTTTCLANFLKSYA